MRREAPAHWGEWRGWMPIPDRDPEHGSGAWVDLSHPVTEDLSRSPAFPAPQFTRLEELPADTANVTQICMAVHHGTHVDAPRHFYNDGPSIDEVPLDRLSGSGVVWSIPAEPGTTIDVADLEVARPLAQPGDIVLLDTGSWPHIDSERYGDAPSLSEEAARWLVARQVKLVGIDAATPDLPAHRRGADFTWPVHQQLLGNGVLIAEHLANLGTVAGKRVELVFGVVPVVGADGGPARVMARVIEE